jgi:hypothetical protein
MAAHADDLPNRVAAAAGKLKMVQISFADEPAEKRRQYATEVVEQMLDTIMPDQRAEFLERLRREFPVWDQAAAFVQAPARGVDDEKPDALLDRFLAAAQWMGEEDKAKVVRRLELAGFAVVPAPEEHDSSDSVPAAVTGDDDEMVLPKRIQDVLQYLMRGAGIQRLDLARTMKLALLLIIFVGNADDLVWKAWKTIAPRSALKRAVSLRKDMVAYISGNKELSGVDLKRNIEVLQRLSAAIIAAIGQAGTLVTRQHLAKFAPQEIQAKAALEGGNVLASQEYKCWNRYNKMARDLEEDVIEHAIREALAKYTETLMQVPQAPAS